MFTQYVAFPDDVAEVPFMSCNEAVADLSVIEFIKLFFNLYKEVGYVNSLDVVIKGGIGGDISLHFPSSLKKVSDDYQ